MRKVNLREKIVAAAVSMFARKGFFETTVDDVARQAKIAKGTIYLYFKDKAALYVSVIEEHMIGAIKFLEKMSREEISCSKKLLKIADQWVSYMLKFKHPFPMFTIENFNLTQKIMKSFNPILLHNINRIIGIIARIIDEGITKGEFRRVHSQLAALHFLNVVRTEYLSQVMFSCIKNPEREIGDIFLSGLKRR